MVLPSDAYTADMADDRLLAGDNLKGNEMQCAALKKDRCQYVKDYSLREGEICYTCAVSMHKLEYHRTQFSMLRISPDNRYIAVRDIKREIKVQENRKEEPVMKLKQLSHHITETTISWSPEEDRQVSGLMVGVLSCGI